MAKNLKIYIVALVLLVCNSLWATDAEQTKLESWRQALLENAFEVACKIPADPHIKDQARAQEQVVSTALELAQPEMAVKYINEIKNWRRGLTMAHLALYLANEGRDEAARRIIELAGRISDDNQEWRNEQIQSKIAEVWIALKQNENADKIKAELPEDRQAEIASAQMANQAMSYEQKLELLQELVATGNFDAIKNSLNAYGKMLDMYYADQEKRQAIIKKISDSWTPMPIIIRIELLSNLARISLAHQDQSQAVDFVQQIQAIYDEHQWAVEYQIIYNALLAELRFASGQKSQALEHQQKALDAFTSEGETIVDIYRAGILCKLAEACEKIGERQQALEVYQKALVHSQINPNSRPRALDLVAICCSMALNDIKPDKQLQENIDKINKGLGQPW